MRMNREGIARVSRAIQCCTTNPSPADWRMRLTFVALRPTATAGSAAPSTFATVGST